MKQCQNLPKYLHYSIFTYRERKLPNKQFRNRIIYLATNFQQLQFINSTVFQIFSAARYMFRYLYQLHTILKFHSARKLLISWKHAFSNCHTWMIKYLVIYLNYFVRSCKRTSSATYTIFYKEDVIVRMNHKINFIMLKIV